MGSREIYRKITGRMTAALGKGTVPGACETGIDGQSAACAAGWLTAALRQDPFSKPAAHAQRAGDLIIGPRQKAAEPHPERDAHDPPRQPLTSGQAGPEHSRQAVTPAPHLEWRCVHHVIAPGTRTALTSPGGAVQPHRNPPAAAVPGDGAGLGWGA